MKGQTPSFSTALKYLDDTAAEIREIRRSRNLDTVLSSSSGDEGKARDILARKLKDVTETVTFHLVGNE